MDKKRKCIGCDITKNSTDMIKITKDYKTDKVVVNPNSKILGRSVYICKDENCISTAMKRNRIERNLKIKLTDEEKENIKILLNNMLVVKH